MFIPTASEKKLIEILIKNSSLNSFSEFSQQFQNMESVIEGCLAKGFVEQASDGMYKLTDVGKSAI